MKVEFNPSVTSKAIWMLLVTSTLLLMPALEATASPNSSQRNSSTLAVAQMQELTALVHPTGSHGCYEIFANNDTVVSFPCKAGGPPYSSISYTPTVDCSSHCYMGYEYNSGAPYEGMYAYEISPTAVPSSSYNNPFASFWTGLESSSTGTLVQSGISYGNYAVTGYGSSTPVAFAEIVGSYTIGGINCNTSFCGFTDAVNVGDDVTFGQYLQSGYWYATYEDYSTNPVIAKTYTVSASTLNYPSMDYGIETFEGYQLSSTSQLPSLSVYADGLSLWTSGTNQITIYLSNWIQAYSPSSTSGLSLIVGMNSNPDGSWG